MGRLNRIHFIRKLNRKKYEQFGDKLSLSISIESMRVPLRTKLFEIFSFVHRHHRMNSGYGSDLVTALRDVVNETNWFCAGSVAKLKKYTCNR